WGAAGRQASAQGSGGAWLASGGGRRGAGWAAGVSARERMACTKGSQPARGSQSQKTRPSSDRRLQLAFVKLESLVIAGQQHCGECVPEPCTHRPSSHEREGHPKSSHQEAPKMDFLIGTKS